MNIITLLFILRRREGQAPNPEVPQCLSDVTETLLLSKLGSTHEVELKQQGTDSLRSNEPIQCAVVVFAFFVLKGWLCILMTAGCPQKNVGFYSAVKHECGLWDRFQTEQRF